jgi:hypothetical protein
LQFCFVKYMLSDISWYHDPVMLSC